MSTAPEVTDGSPASPPKIRALAPWFGGKRTLAADIVQQLGPHSQYLEPFCGSMAVLLAKPATQKETVNDLHGDLINLATVIQFEPSAIQLYDLLQRAIFSDDILAQAREHLAGDVHQARKPWERLDRAYWYFVASWMGRNGTAGTARVDYQLAVRWTKGGGSPTVRWSNAIESIPAWHRRLKNVVILRRDAFSVIPKLEDTPDTAIYCDPPYAAETRCFTKNGQGSQYLHEFTHRVAAAAPTPLFGDDDAHEQTDHHEQLRDLLAAYKRARIVVSYYDCPRIRELYAGWTFVDKTRQKHLHSQAGRGARKLDAPEVLIINGPEF